LNLLCDLFIANHTRNKEFVNEVMHQLCEDNKIKIVRGRVRHPQTQGCVENLNSQISQSLRIAYNSYLRANSNTKWNIQAALQAYLAAYNGKIYAVTKETPNSLVITTDTVTIASVKERISQYYSQKNSKIPRKVLRKGTKVFIVKKVRVSADKKKLIEPPSHKFQQQNVEKIAAEIANTRNMHLSQVDVRIKSSTHNHILVNRVYTINVSCLALAKSVSWKAKVNKK